MILDTAVYVMRSKSKSKGESTRKQLVAVIKWADAKSLVGWIRINPYTGREELETKWVPTTSLDDVQRAPTYTA